MLDQEGSELKNELVELSRPDYGEREIAAVAAVLQSGWTTTGPQTAGFEKAFCEFTGARFALGVNSGSAALHLALSAHGAGPGDEVITTPLTFCATVNAILLTGATPVLADIGEDLNISPEAVRRAITPRTRAILPVHYAGLPCDMKSIHELAREHNLFVVEDAAHAAGAASGSVRVGAGASDAIAFSFYATKNLSTGEGGMVTCHDERLYERMRVLSLHGITRDAWGRHATKDNWAYEVTACGFKYNMSDVTAAIGLVQLARLEEMNRRRAAIASAYNAAFSRMPELELPPDPAGMQHAWQLYVLRLNLDKLRVDRSEFISEMRRRGVECSVHFIPISLHPYYRARLEVRDVCARTMAEYPRLVSLPMSSALGDGDVEKVMGAVRKTIEAHRCR